MIRWHERYRPEWDADPWRYLHAGVLPHGRSRRLGTLASGPSTTKVHLGIQHFDPELWGYRGEPYCRFFVSIRFGTGRRSADLRTFSTMAEALARVDALRAAMEQAGS